LFELVLLDAMLEGIPPDWVSEVVLLDAELEVIEDGDPEAGTNPDSFWARPGLTSELSPLKLWVRSMSACEY
jgi:hypothetical protein